MVESASRSEPRACRTPEDEAHLDKEPTPDAARAGQSEKPRQACALDIDWNQHEARSSEAPAVVFGPPPPPPKQATNNATRTTETKLGSSGYADAGYSRGADSFYAGVAAIKGRDASGVEVESLSASVQVGAQNEAQVTGQRLAFSNGHVAVSIEGGTANAHAGFANPDGSVGLNGGAQTSAVYGEVTLSGAANSVSVGLGIGSGAEASIGVRDKNHDDNPEVCFRVAFAIGMVGACIELPFHEKM